jgi:hypothetical protein
VIRRSNPASSAARSQFVIAYSQLCHLAAGSCAPANPGEHRMAYAVLPDFSYTQQELTRLERGYRRDLQDLAAARASYASLRDVTDRDEREILRVLARIEILQEAR